MHMHGDFEKHGYMHTRYDMPVYLHNASGNSSRQYTRLLVDNILQSISNIQQER